MNARLGSMGLALTLLGSASSVASAAAVAAEACVPVVEHGWVRAAPPGAMMLAGYLTLRNSCADAASVVSTESADFGEVMIHRTETVDGVSRMRHVDEVALASGQNIEFEPGGMHLMLMQPRRDLAEGDSVRIVFRLADGSMFEGEFQVRREAAGR